MGMVMVINLVFCNTRLHPCKVITNIKQKSHYNEVTGFFVEWKGSPTPSQQGGVLQADSYLKNKYTIKIIFSQNFKFTI